MSDGVGSENRIPQWFLNKMHGVAIGMPLGVALYWYTDSALLIAVIAVAIAITNLSYQVRGDLRAIE